MPTTLREWEYNMGNHKHADRLHTVKYKSATMDTNFMVCKKHIIIYIYIYINKGLSAGGD